MKKLVTISLSAVLLVTLAGCGNSSKSSNASSASDTTSSKVNSDSSSSAAKSSSKAAASASSSSVASATNLTNTQAVSWIKANMGSTILSEYNTGSTQFTTDDFTYNSNGNYGPTGTDDSVYYQIRENHNSANMQAANADPATSPSAGWFKITSAGALEYYSNSTGAWTTVSSSYNG